MTKPNDPICPMMLEGSLSTLPMQVSGLTKRELFAVMILQSCAATNWSFSGEHAVKKADELIKALNAAPPK